MDLRNNNDSLRLTGRIDKQTHDVSDLQAQYSDWDSMSKKQKLQASREVEPSSEETVYNVTTDRLHEYFVDNLDRGQTDSAANVNPAWLGLGTNASAGTATSDTDLNTRTFEESVTDHSDNGKELLTSTFVASSDGNGNTFNELGLFSGNPANLSNDDTFLMNHATFSDVTKDNTKTVTFDVTLTFSDV